MPATEQAADLRYPIGKFNSPESISENQRRKFIDELAAAPGRLRAAAQGLTPAQLETPYRPGGWTVRQVVHHVPDSHMNSYIRFKLALTEDVPTIKAYKEDLWAELTDSRSTPIETSLSLLETLHQRWVVLLRSLKESDWQRQFRHPEVGPMRLDVTLALYAWHSAHHTAHITSLRERNGW
jgi:uncharacterized damage-inducible protein DinB